MRSPLLAAMAPAIASAQSLTALGFLQGGTESQPWDVSVDGAVVVGRATSSDGTYRAFRWTRQGGMVSLGTLGSYSEGRGVSADGSVVVGFTNSAEGFRAFRWTGATGMESLGVLPGGSSSGARAVSDSGAVVVGAGDLLSCGCYVGLRWDAGGVVSMGIPPGEQPTVRCEAVSGDGAVAVGSVYSGGVGGVTTAFRWTAGTGMVNIGGLPGHGYSAAYGVNADGSVVVGVSIEEPGSGLLRAFRWVSGQGAHDLGLAPGENSAGALAVSADGSVVVGTSGTRAILWRQDIGMVDLNAHLPALGLNLSGWTLTSAMAITPDGRTMVGYGTHNGLTEAWLVELGCYVNCDNSTIDPVLNVQDFTCFLNSFTAGAAYANCDASTVAPVLNVQDFLCFLNRFASGCS